MRPVQRERCISKARQRGACRAWPKDVAVAGVADMNPRRRQPEYKPGHSVAATRHGNDKARTKAGPSLARMARLGGRKDDPGQSSQFQPARRDFLRLRPGSRPAAAAGMDLLKSGKGVDGPFRQGHAAINRKARLRISNAGQQVSWPSCVGQPFDEIGPLVCFGACAATAAGGDTYSICSSPRRVTPELRCILLFLGPAVLAALGIVCQGPLATAACNAIDSASTHEGRTPLTADSG